MFSKRTSMISMAVVTSLAPMIMAATPAFAQSSSTVNSKPASAQVVVAKPGTDVASATQPMNGWVQIPANSMQWYKFHYHYNDVTANPNETSSANQNTPSQALVKLTMQNAGSISFNIWTPGTLQNPAHNPKDIFHGGKKRGKADHSKDMIEPVGSGTPMVIGTVHSSDIQAGAYPRKDQGQAITNAQTLAWAGSATASDTYYVAVKNNTNAPASYMLSISGPDVSFPQ